MLNMHEVFTDVNQSPCNLFNQASYKTINNDYISLFYT